MKMLRLVLFLSLTLNVGACYIVCNRVRRHVELSQILSEHNKASGSPYLFEGYRLCYMDERANCFSVDADSKSWLFSWMLDASGNSTNVVFQYNKNPCLVDMTGRGRLSLLVDDVRHNKSCPQDKFGSCASSSPSRPAAPSRRVSSAPLPAAAYVPPESANALEARPPAAASRMERARAAAEKNLVMDALLGGDAIPADYGESRV